MSIIFPQVVMISVKGEKVAASRLDTNERPPPTRTHTNAQSLANPDSEHESSKLSESSKN